MILGNQSKTIISNNSRSSYRQIFKATSLFGGVQFVNILLSIIRSKIIAVLLGPSGMGIAGLLTATTGLVSSLTNFGLGTSAVKDVANAHQSGNVEKVRFVITVFRRLVWITGIFGCLVMMVLSPLLSKFTFGNTQYTIAFIWLSITLLFNQLTSGQDVLLQGMRKLQSLAKANVFGSCASLLVSILFYYFLKTRGIVPALIATSVITLCVTWYFSKSVGVKKVNISKTQTVIEGKGMLKMGFMLSLSSLISIAASYFVRIFISNRGGVSDVGLYNAGFAIISTYVGLVFSAMGTDYYPRLSGVSNDSEKTRSLINQQAEIAILILAPILCIFLIFINPVVILLYSSKFLPVNEMIHWAALGIYFKSASWSLGFILLAKGDSKTFFWTEVLANFYLTLLNILGYRYFGFEGLGMSFFFGYVIFLFQIYYTAKMKYSFSFHSAFYKIFILQFFLGLICFVIVRVMAAHLSYIFGVMIICISLLISLIQMNKRIGLKSLIGTLKSRR